MEFGKFFGPMLLSEKARPFDDDDFIYELKYDGIRALVHVSSKDIHIYTRHGVDVTKQYPELESLKKSVKKEVIVDGEIVIFEDGVPNFSKLASRNRLKDEKRIRESSIRNPVCFVAFDILYENKPLIDEPLLKRKKMLDKYPVCENFLKTEYIEKEGIKLFEKVVEAHLEGMVAKKKDSTYSIETRSSDWIKVKNLKKGIFFVGGCVDNKVKGSLLLGEYRNKKLYFVGKVSISKTSKLYKRLKSLVARKKSPFVDFDDQDIKYLSPSIRVEVSYMERTPSGNLRQPIFKKEVQRRV